jgi:hypothetical protein
VSNGRTVTSIAAHPINSLQSSITRSLQGIQKDEILVVDWIGVVVERIAAILKSDIDDGNGMSRFWLVYCRGEQRIGGGIEPL